MTEPETDERYRDIGESVRAGSYSVDALLVADAILDRWSGRSIARDWASARDYPTVEDDSTDASYR